MTKDEALKWLRTPTAHYECEDCWYSCAILTCDENRKSDVCDCGADERARIKAEIAELVERHVPQEQPR